MQSVKDARSPARSLALPARRRLTSSCRVLKQNVDITPPPAVAASVESPLDIVTTPKVTSAGAGFMEAFQQSPLVQRYLAALEKHPLRTKQWTAFSGFFIGDIVAQLVTESSYDPSRTLILATYGFFLDAPVGNAFYVWLDANIEPGRAQTAKAVGIKIAIDQLLYSPIMTAVLYAFLCCADLDPASIPATLQEKVLPTLLANYTIWPAAHALNFYFVPTEQRILYNNFVAICWTTWLSMLSH